VWGTFRWCRSCSSCAQHAKQLNSWIDGESLIILAGRAGLLKRLDIGEKVFLSGDVRTKLGRIKILCNQLAELGLRQECDGDVFRSSLARPTDTPVYASGDTSRHLPQDWDRRSIGSSRC